MKRTLSEYEINRLKKAAIAYALRGVKLQHPIYKYFKHVNTLDRETKEKGTVK